MLFNTGSDCKHIGVKDDVFRPEADLLHQQLIGAPADRNPALQGVCLPLFIKSHHHHGSAILFHSPRLVKKRVLSLFQADRVNNSLALKALQALFNHLPP